MGGVEAQLNKDALSQNDFISNWTCQVTVDEEADSCTVDGCAKASLVNSYKNALSFPWIKERIDRGEFAVHLWFFDIKEGLIYAYKDGAFEPLTGAAL